ncbi:MAG TPA: MBL fold metallo-hydrolase [Rhizomicrobium sp.]|nr:MBL fold metallo-hydrolase [Rhizomicrobium sp.]
MMRSLLVLALLAAAAPCRAAPALKMVTIDTEEGAATLFVTPQGRSLLIDTGSPAGSDPKSGLDGARNGADRIAAAARSLGVRRIDDVIITHYHGGHVGGVVELLARLPVGTFIDHGPDREMADPRKPGDAPANRRARKTRLLYEKYLAAIKGHRHIVARPGDVFHFGSLTDTIVASDGKLVARALPGAGKPGALCGTPPMTDDGGLENTQSVASLLSFGKVRIAAMGDLTWNHEHDLFCPIDKMGHVNILLVSHHGIALSSNPSAIAALRPDIAVVGNSAIYGAVPATVKTISASKGLQGFWRMHASVAHPELNGDPDFIANLAAAPDHGDVISQEIWPDGRITVSNSRNGFSKTYRVK